MSIKQIIGYSSLIGMTIFSVWSWSFTNHNNFSKLEIVPEWNGPDYKITYYCKGDYDKIEGLDMQRKGDYVTVNYGALGRRRYGTKSFRCHY